jgi:hypothetical protein
MQNMTISADMEYAWSGTIDFSMSKTCKYQ